MNITTIEKVKKGDYFKVLRAGDVSTLEMEMPHAGKSITTKVICPANAKRVEGYSVQVADGYNRSTKKYSYYRWDDINHYGEKKKGTQVLVDFDF